MGNTHGIADMAFELQSTAGDLLPACVISTSWPPVPVPPSLTLAPFVTRAYVRAGQQLTYVDQPAQAVVLTGSDGNYWIAVTDDTWSSFAGWTRTPGSHYAWRLSATRPADVDNLLVALSLTVSGGAITAVTPAPGVTLAEALRAQAGLGTMATQNANAVAITGGSATGLSSVTTTGNVGIATSTPGYPLDVAGNVRLFGKVGMGVDPSTDRMLNISYDKSLIHGIILHQQGSDTGAGAALMFLSIAGAAVGSIATTATATAYNTSSDVRIKRNIAPLTGSLAVIAALKPVTFRWNADDSVGHGFLAHELQQTLPEAVSGLPDEVNDDGSIKPQQVDHSKLVPWLTAALKEALTQVDALTQRVASLETALGV